MATKARHTTDTTREEFMNMAEKGKAQMSELFEKAIQNYEDALKTGLKIQEESGKWWAKMLEQTGSAQDWQRQIRAMASELLPETQKRVEQSLKLMEQNGRMSLELFQRAMEAAQSSSIMEGQNRFMQLWEASLNAIKDSTQAVTMANSKALESWMDFFRKNAEMATPRRA